MIDWPQLAAESCDRVMFSTAAASVMAQARASANQTTPVRIKIGAAENAKLGKNAMVTKRDIE